jgi:hypothetical protein
MTQTLFVVSFIKLNNCFGHQAKGLQSTLNKFIAIRAISELGLTALTVAESLLKLPNGYFVETHRDKVVGCNLTYGVCFFNELVALLGMTFASFSVLLYIGQMELMSCKDVHGTDPGGLVFK